MGSIARKIYSLGKSWFRTSNQLTVSTPEDLLEFSHWIESSPLRMDVPIELLRMQGGFAYTTEHPFVRALRKGEVALRDFYTEFQPRTITEFYNLEGVGRLGEDLPPWEIPWYFRKSRTPPPGEKKLGPEHGVSFFGPAAEEKIGLEMSRLRSVQKSIKSNGFSPDNYSDIEGCVLRDGDNLCFFVRGGKHRAAALASLGIRRCRSHFGEDFRG